MYDITCVACCGDGNTNKPAIYTGQTSLSLHERGKQHLVGFLKKSDASPLYKHVMEAHDGEEVDFKMKVIRKHFTAFSRLVHEAVRIERLSNAPDIRVLNSKSEYGRTKLPRLTIEEENLESSGVESRKNSFLSSRAGTVCDNEESKDSKNAKENDSSSDEEEKLGSLSHRQQLSKTLLIFLRKSRRHAAYTNNKPNFGGGVKTADEVRTGQAHNHVSNNFKFRQKLNNDRWTGT